MSEPVSKNLKPINHDCWAELYWRKQLEIMRNAVSDIIPILTNSKDELADCVNTKNAFRLIQSIPSPKAEPFKQWLAKVGYERIQEIANPEFAQDRINKQKSDHMQNSDITSRRKALKSELKRVVNELKKAGVERIILFGSLARDDIGMASDIDLLVVQETKKRFMERLVELYEIINPRYALDLLVYTPSEFNEMKENTIFIKKIISEGKLLYEA